MQICCESIPFKESDLPQPGQCGTQLKERIVGGEQTNIQDFPWMALIQYSKCNIQLYYKFSHQERSVYVLCFLCVFFF